MARTIAEVMMPDPVTCSPDSQVREAAQLMRDQDIGDVVVVDGQRVQGIVTDRDLVVRALAGGLDSTAPLGDVLSDSVVAVTPEATVDQAAQIMRDRAVRRLPVVEGDRLVGIVSIGDLAIHSDPTSALADISAAPANS